MRSNCPSKLLMPNPGRPHGVSSVANGSTKPRLRTAPTSTANASPSVTPSGFRSLMNCASRRDSQTPIAAGAATNTAYSVRMPRTSFMYRGSSVRMTSESTLASTTAKTVRYEMPSELNRCHASPNRATLFDTASRTSAVVPLRSSGISRKYSAAITNITAQTMASGVTPTVRRNSGGRISRPIAWAIRLPKSLSEFALGKRSCSTMRGTADERDGPENCDVTANPTATI